MAAATLIADPEATVTPRRPESRSTYSCPWCEHVLRVSGLGRHRVYFELANERSYDPVMNRICPECGHGLPGKGAW